jgi:type IV pilus assembly protein PilM
MSDCNRTGAAGASLSVPKYMFERLRQPVFSKRPAPEPAVSLPANELDVAGDPVAEEQAQVAEPVLAGEETPVDVPTSAADGPIGESGPSPSAPILPLGEEPAAPAQPWQTPVDEEQPSSVQSSQTPVEEDLPSPARSWQAPAADEPSDPVQPWQAPIHEEPPATVQSWPTPVQEEPPSPVQSWQTPAANEPSAPVQPPPVHEEPAAPVEAALPPAPVDDRPADDAASSDSEEGVEATVVATRGRKTRRRPEKKSGSTRGQERPLIGLDIEPGLLVAVRSRLHGRLEVEQAAYMPIGFDVVRDGEVTDVAALAEALGQLFETSRLDRRVRIGIANQRIMMRRIELPPLTDANEIDQAVRFQAQDEIPMPLDSVVLDYRSLGILDNGSGPRLSVLLVAARRDMIERVLQASRLAGLQPEGVDLAAFGMVRALRPQGAAANEQILYLSIGGLTNLAISHGPTCEFTHVIGSGVEQIAADLASRCGIPLVDARQLLASSELADMSASIAAETPPASLRAPDAASAFIAPTPAAPPREFPDPGPAQYSDGRETPAPATQATSDQLEVAGSALIEGVRRIAAEVRNSLDFYLAAQGGEPVRQAVLCGPALEVRGFDGALSRELGIPVARGEVALASPGAAGDVPQSLLAVAAGLSLADGAP